MRRVYLWMAIALLLGMTGCNKEEATQQQDTQGTETVVTEEATVEESATEEGITEEVTEEAMTSEEAMVEEPTTEEATTEQLTIVPSTQEGATLTPEDAEAMIVSIFGTKDESTGNDYSYSHVNTMTVNGVEYHVFMWGWIVDDHFSKLTDLFVATDGSAIHEGIFVGDGATVYTDTNYLNQ